MASIRILMRIFALILPLFTSIRHRRIFIQNKKLNATQVADRNRKRGNRKIV